MSGVYLVEVLHKSNCLICEMVSMNNSMTAHFMWSSPEMNHRVILYLVLYIEGEVEYRIKARNQLFHLKHDFFFNRCLLDNFCVDPESSELRVNSIFSERVNVCFVVISRLQIEKWSIALEVTDQLVAGQIIVDCFSLLFFFWQRIDRRWNDLEPLHNAHCVFFFHTHMHKLLRACSLYRVFLCWRDQKKCSMFRVGRYSLREVLLYIYHVLVVEGEDGKMGTREITKHTHCISWTEEIRKASHKRNTHNHFHESICRTLT
jgi:hypothetical protein